MNRKCEREVTVHMIGFLRILFDESKRGEIRERIIFAKGDEAAYKIININKGMRMIGDAIKSDKVIGLKFRYIPIDVAGTEYLKRITDFTESAIVAILFSEQEINAAREKESGAAVIGNLICYEFMSCNISKIVNAFKIHKEHISEIGFVIDEQQL